METFPFFLKYPFTQMGRVGRKGRPDNTRQHNCTTRTDVELTLPDSHAKCVGAWPLYDAKRGTTKTQRIPPGYNNNNGVGSRRRAYFRGLF